MACTARDCRLFASSCWAKARSRNAAAAVPVKTVRRRSGCWAPAARWKASSTSVRFSSGEACGASASRSSASAENSAGTARARSTSASNSPLPPAAPAAPARQNATSNPWGKRAMARLYRVARRMRTGTIEPCRAAASPTAGVRNAAARRARATTIRLPLRLRAVRGTAVRAVGRAARFGEINCDTRAQASSRRCRGCNRPTAGRPPPPRRPRNGAAPPACTARMGAARAQGRRLR